MGKGSSAVWRTILQIALATMLIIGGCNVFFGNLWTKATSSDELIQAVGSLFNGDLKKIVIYVLAAIEILAGIFMILDLFRIKSVDKLDDICVLIIMILWLVVFIVMGDILPLIRGRLDFVPFLSKISKDLVILCSFGIVRTKI
ncbi:MAG: hypothetical protein IJA53_04420 [Spirochaetaceae bacterium]|nr:hypothetical protein [Spirochaetaceae bacterium]MBQ4554335.1 hypothetical protein [Spirochaetaceae bacterium]MBQ8353245.1 hypothetical protein [Spirochaetaceae bacterium]